MSGGIHFAEVVAIYLIVAYAPAYLTGRWGWKGGDEPGTFVIFWPLWLTACIFVAVIAGPIWLGLRLYQLGLARAERK